MRSRTIRKLFAELVVDVQHRAAPILKTDSSPNRSGLESRPRAFAIQSGLVAHLTVKHSGDRIEKDLMRLT
jgi:hypothetical protein